MDVQYYNVRQVQIRSPGIVDVLQNNAGKVQTGAHGIVCRWMETHWVYSLGN